MAELPAVFNGILGQAFLSWAKPGDTAGLKLDPGRFGLQRTLKVNSEVRWYENQVTYSFSLGTALALADAVVELVCSPRLMPDIGVERNSEPAKANPAPVVPRARFCDYSNRPIQEYCQSWPFPVQPVGGVRIRLAFDLFDLASKFICLHEQGHYLNGHLDLLLSHGVELGWAETEGRAKYGIATWALRVFEIQADTFAAQILLNPWAQVGHKGIQLAHGPDASVYFRRCVTVAFAVVSAILELNDRNASPNSANRTHPSAGARLLNVLRYVMVSRGTETRKGDSGIVETIVDPSMFEDITTVFDLLGVEPICQDDFMGFFTVDGKNATQRGDRANEVRELLALVPSVRAELGGFAAASLRRIARPEGGTLISETDLGKGFDGMKLKGLGHMSIAEFQLYLMEAVVRSGEHIPWDCLSTPDFMLECLQRGAKIVAEEYPGVFFQKST